MLRAQDIHHAYDRKKILSGIDLHLKPASVVAITGDNGTGKTTLLKILAGVLTPTRGQVETQAARSFFMPATSLYEDLTVNENLLLHAGLLGVSPDQSLIQGFSLSPDLNKRVRDLSAGQKNKVALCRVLSSMAEIILMDEPLTALDPTSQKILLEVLLLKKKQGASILMTTHARVELEGLVDQSLQMKEGSLHDL